MTTTDEALTERVQVLVTPEEKERVERQAAKEDRTQSYIGRRALLAELRKVEKR